MNVPYALGCLPVGLVLLAYAFRSEPVKVVTVVDGDTVMVVTRNGRRKRVRLLGIDAPEKDQRGGVEARTALQRLTQGKWVRARWHGIDHYGRWLAQLRVDGRDVSYALVREGVVFPQGSWLLHLNALWPRITFKGIWVPWQPRPDASMRRKYVIWGHLQAHRDNRLRKQQRK